ncbi:hypothetical protein GIB67_042482 [Kingdonia uniflora]|uniref:Phosphatidylinositol-glycan biosynthesis class X protein n=1 Tax=Kingdonia uniflora TaxID=39325 RepID=A0A7J7M0Y0_9MAGN|nr:hypothetical protein GIB67_042482 [Kingdonia uniflora]
MGSQHLVKLLVVFTVLHFATNFVETCNLLVNGNSDPNCIASQKYLMKSYFKKYNTLLDSDFEDFLPYELLGSCNTLSHSITQALKISMQRDLAGEGSHRRLLSVIKIHIEPEATSVVPVEYQVIVIERLPSGVFADPFELQHLVQRGVFSDAAVFGDTNLELPSALSNCSVVEIHMEINHGVLSRHERGLEVKIDLPLHARYPPLDGSGYSMVQMGAPDVYVRYNIEENLQFENCVWRITAVSLKPQGAVVWKIPSGNKAHTGVVSNVTFVSALLSTLLIVLTALFDTNTENTKNSKQS